MGIDRSSRSRQLIVAALALALALAACARRPDVAAPPPGAVGTSGRRLGPPPEIGAAYGEMGLLVARGDLPFAGTVARFAGPTPDSTLVLVALSLTNGELTFAREGDRYRAAYEVRIDVRKGDSTVRRIAADEIVRVATYRETSRIDESVLFYQYVTLSPESYTLAVSVRDANGGRSSTVQTPLDVPRLTGGLSTPVVVYGGRPRTRADSAPDVTVRPRATVTFGQDSALALYLEAYRPAASAPRLPLRITARADGDVVVWSDTVSLDRRGAAGAPYAGVVHLPVARLGVGVVSVDVVTADVPVDSARARALVSLGDELPAATFDEVLGYLRYYATAERLRALRETPADQRAAAWAAFVRASDPQPATPEHEGLRDYLARLRAANARFGDEGTGQPGWLTDRGLAYIVLGEPDQIVDPTEQDPSARGRTQRWVYRGAEKLTLTFADQTGFGRWRLNGSSNAALQAALRRKLVP